MTETLTTVQAEGRVTLPGSGEVFNVPSGQAVTLHEVIIDHPSPDNAIYRFRFLAPAIGRDAGTMDFATSSADLTHLCETYAVQNLAAPLPAAVQVIISFSDLVVPFGETNPNATQFFLAFNIEDGVCVLEPY